MAQQQARVRSLCEAEKITGAFGHGVAALVTGQQQYSGREVARVVIGMLGR